MSVPSPGVTKFVNAMGSSMGLSQLASERYLPTAMAVRNGVRDGIYMTIDLPRIVNRVTTSYGYFRKYLRQMRKHGKVNPEDFKDCDLSELRMMVNAHFNNRGPLSKIDFRIFNWMYLFMGVVVLYEAYFIQKGMDAKVEGGAGLWESRKAMYDDDYEEDVRR